MKGMVFVRSGCQNVSSLAEWRGLHMKLFQYQVHRPIFVSALLYDVNNFELDCFRLFPAYAKDVFIFSRKAPGRIANWTDSILFQPCARCLDGDLFFRLTPRTASIQPRLTGHYFNSFRLARSNLFSLV